MYLLLVFVLVINFILLLWFLFAFEIYSPRYPGVCYVDQAGPEASISVSLGVGTYHHAQFLFYLALVKTICCC